VARCQPPLDRDFAPTSIRQPGMVRKLYRS
jgi:hypothetical protein